MDKIGDIKVCCSQCNMPPQKKVMIECIDCQRETNHNVVAQATKENSYNVNTFCLLWDHNEWEILECCGCGQVTFRKQHLFSEDCEPDGSYIPTISLFPQRSKDYKSLKDYYKVPLALITLYREVISCYNSETYILCAAGLRALVEGICRNKGVKNGLVETDVKGGAKETKRKDNFEGKIEGLYEKGFLTREHANILHAHRFLGNKALHELEKPSKKEIELAIEIIEHTFENIYDLKAKHEDFQREQLRRKESTTQKKQAKTLFDL